MYNVNVGLKLLDNLMIFLLPSALPKIPILPSSSLLFHRFFRFLVGFSLVFQEYRTFQKFPMPVPFKFPIGFLEELSLYNVCMEIMIYESGTTRTLDLLCCLRDEESQF